MGLLAPLYPVTGGYLVKRVMAGIPVALPMLSVRADLLPTLVGTMVQAAAPIRPSLPEGQNIVAWLPGSDPQLAGEPLLLGAHYDGIGDDPGGLRLPGATDNAAAASVLLEVARMVKLLPEAPRRPLGLIAFDSEEVGAQGSRVAAQRFSEKGLTPSLLNIDGAACQNEAVWVEVGPQAEALVQALDQAGRWLDIPLILGNIASDHRQFMAAGLPALGLSIGAAKLHTPGDALALVQPEALHRAVTLLGATLWQRAWGT
ncbi:MAG: M28 family peptidase [Ktedonobacteraceae bacterium]